MIGEDGVTRSHAFDGAAGSYDRDFTDRQLGSWLREEVWHWLGETFQKGDRLLELGCGTGEDAIWLARQGMRVTATDGSAGMLARASQKVELAGLSAMISLATFDIASVTLNIHKSNHENGLFDDGPWDGAFSNFGALNCTSDRTRLARALASCIQPGGYVVLVLMGPLCPWEIIWHLLHGEPRTAMRRFRRGVAANVAEGATIKVWYPSPRRLTQEFAPAFRHVRTVGIGSILPPSYLVHLIERWPQVWKKLAQADRVLGPRFPWNWLNDHYLMVLRRRDDRGSADAQQATS